jgi:hypothetical protein
MDARDGEHLLHPDLSGDNKLKRVRESAPLNEVSLA